LSYGNYTVVIIIGILFAIAIPAYLAQRDDARLAVVRSDARQAGTAVSTCLLDAAAATECDEDSAAELQAFGYNKSNAVTFNGTVNAAGDVVTTHTWTGTGINATYNSGTGNVTP
jgi:type II secretory pathway pseudopilin PulG